VGTRNDGRNVHAGHRRKGYDMGPGITLVVVGAILAFAVRTESTVLDLQVVGLIFMLAGAAIIAFYRRERHQKHVVTRVEHTDPGVEPAETVQQTITHETIYAGDESPPASPDRLRADQLPSTHRSVHGVERH
jgi:hypothetical protein